MKFNRLPVRAVDRVGVGKLISNTMSIVVMFVIATLAGCGTTPTALNVSSAVEPIKPKVIVVTMFEIGEDEGDKAGEFQLWKERRNLNVRFPFKNSHHDIYYNDESGIMVIVTGIGTAKSSSAIMALGMDPRFDLSQSYWLVAGIAGIDPEDASVGSAAWAENLIDGDLAHHIDMREAPKDWDTGYFPLFTQKPYDPNKQRPLGEVYQLNLPFVNWAYELTKNVEIDDDASLSDIRNQYTQHPNAKRKPFVMKGDQLAAMTFWHGELHNTWANNWVKYWTDGVGEFVTSAMEDTGTYLSLNYLTQIDRANVNRLLVLRTGSNYTMQPPNKTAVQNLIEEGEDYAGLDVALESAYKVGSVVVDEIIGNWSVYQGTTPAAQ